jgi:hypothetical protein
MRATQLSTIARRAFSSGLPGVKYFFAQLASRTSLFRSLGIADDLKSNIQVL